MEINIIEFENIEKSYSIGGIKLTVLDNISLSIKKGQFVALVGDSGAGKSTLMNMVGKLDTPDKGRVMYEGENIIGYNNEQTSKYRNKIIGFVFQNFNLDNSLTALENVQLPLYYADISKKKRIIMAEEALEKVGLSNRIHHRPNEMSGGQKQRVAIARAIVNLPKIILADEPTGNLDEKSGNSVMNLLSEINKNGATIIMVTHNPEHAKYAGRIVRLNNGQIVSDCLKTD